MTVELSLIIAAISLIFGIYQGVNNLKRNSKKDTTEEATQIATVITMLDNIKDGINDIKSEMTNMKLDIKEIWDKLIRVEVSVAQAHKRIDELRSQHEE